MKTRIGAALLVLLATVKVAADLFEQPEVSAIATVTNAAPAMKVFTAHRGYETYSSRFALSVQFKDGEVVNHRLNPATYAGLHGPYNRRNVYGALIAYGPVLVANPKTLPMWREMAQRGFCREAGVIAELGLANRSGVSRARIDYLDQVSEGSDYVNKLEVICE